MFVHLSFLAVFLFNRPFSCMTVDGHACWYLCPSKTHSSRTSACPRPCNMSRLEHLKRYRCVVIFSSPRTSSCFFGTFQHFVFFSKVYCACRFPPQKLTCLVLPLCLCAWMCSSCPHERGCCGSCLSRWRSGTPWGTKRDFPSLGARGRMAGWWLQSSPKLSTPSLTRDLTWD